MLAANDIRRQLPAWRTCLCCFGSNGTTPAPSGSCGKHSNSRANLDLAAAAQSDTASKWQWPADWADTSTFTSRWHLRAQISPAIVYSRVLATKGAVLTRQRRARDHRRLPADPRSEAAGRLADYQQTVSRLATMAFATPNPKQASAWQKTMDELYRHRDQLETELSRQDADFLG